MDNRAKVTDLHLNGVSEWAYEAMCWAVRKRLYSAEELNPQGTVTKSELVSLLIAAKKLK